MKFDQGDIVVASGLTIESNKRTLNSIVCEVVECGIYDVFLKTVDDYSTFPKIFAYSLKRCQKLNLNIVDPSCERVSPKIGNLVLSMYSNLGSIEKCVGVLDKIIDKPGRTKTGLIRNSTKKTTVPFNTLIILEE